MSKQQFTLENTLIIQLRLMEKTGASAAAGSYANMLAPALTQEVCGCVGEGRLSRQRWLLMRRSCDRCCYQVT